MPGRNVPVVAKVSVATKTRLEEQRQVLGLSMSEHLSNIIEMSAEISLETKRKLDKECKALGISVSKHISNIIEKHLSGAKKPKG